MESSADQPFSAAFPRGVVPPDVIGVDEPLVYVFYGLARQNCWRRSP